MVTGVWAVPTVFHLARFVDEYDFILNIGIAGSYSSRLMLGQVVNICKDIFGDYGVDDNGKFISLYRAGLMEQSTLIEGYVMENPWAEKFSIQGLAPVKGVTLGTASGSENVINRIVSSWNPDVETMEGAAVFYSCLCVGKPFLCIRAISNVVEPRNRSNWKIDEALANLHDQVLKLFSNLDVLDL
jgi:futalosine hydrolase